MGPKANKEDKDLAFLRTVIVSVICIPVIVWLFYSAYQKNQQSGARTSACEKQCIERGYNGYSFKWSMFSDPACTCLGTRQLFK